METNKGNIAVKLTKKNCKNVLGILEMFGEKPSPGLKDTLTGLDPICENRYVVFNEPSGTFYKTYGLDGQTLVKPRELRNILAKEHLKVGDVCVFKTGHGKEVEARILSRVDDSDWPFECKQKGATEVYRNFLRYATDEEKALLEPKSEFGVDNIQLGVWYKWKNGCLIVYEHSTAYGFSQDGVWTKWSGWAASEKQNVRKATDTEVIEALKKECVKRYGEDWENAKIKAHADGFTGDRNLNRGTFRGDTFESNKIWNKNGSLYFYGKWAEKLEEEKPSMTTEPVHPTRQIRKIEIAEFIGIPVEQLEIID